MNVLSFQNVNVSDKYITHTQKKKLKNADVKIAELYSPEYWGHVILQCNLHV